MSFNESIVEDVTLVTLRDTLLLKLLSGELSVERLQSISEAQS